MVGEVLELLVARDLRIFMKKNNIINVSSLVLRAIRSTMCA